MAVRDWEYMDQNGNYHSGAEVTPGRHALPGHPADRKGGGGCGIRLALPAVVTLVLWRWFR